MNSTELETVIRENLERNDILIRLDLKGGGYGGLRVFYAYKKGGAYYIDDYTSERTRTMKYHITDQFDILIKTMKEYAALDNWRVVEREFSYGEFQRGTSGN